MHDEQYLLKNVPLRGWAPGAHWRLLLMALTEDVPGDSYWIDTLRVTSAALLPHAPASFSVALNGQDFTNGQVPPMNYTYAYHSDPVVVGISPPDGPLSGSTLVRVTGRNFAQGSDYRCRFGNASVAATLDGSLQNTLSCTSPADGTNGLGGGGLGDGLSIGHGVGGGVGADVPFAIALNAQNYYEGSEAGAFRYHSVLKVSAVLPPMGPTE